MYVGTSPPLNRVVKKKKNANLFLHGKSFLESTYPVIVERNTAKKVPTKVTHTVVPYARIICSGFFRHRP